MRNEEILVDIKNALKTEAGHDVELKFNEITGDYQYFSNYLEELILKIIKRKYINNPFYTELLNDL